MVKKKVHNEFLISNWIITFSANAYITSSTDGSEHSNTVEYLCTIAKQSI